MVIQRIQTVYLLIACAMMVLFTCLPLAQVNTADMSLTLTSIGLKAEGIGGAEPSGTYILHTWPIFISSVVAAVVAFLAIFQYRNLRFQKLLCIAVALLTFGSALAAFIISYVEGETVSFSGWTITPFISLLFSILAYLAITKDQRLLSSADRLR